MSSGNQNVKPMLEHTSAYYKTAYQSYNDSHHGESK